MCTVPGWVYVGLPNVCCTAFGYDEAPFSMACLLINPETLIASRVARGAGGSRVLSVHTRVCDATHVIHVAASVAACLYVPLSIRLTLPLGSRE